MECGKAILEYCKRVGRNGKLASIDTVMKNLPTLDYKESRSTIGNWRMMAENEYRLLTHYGSLDGVGYQEALDQLRQLNHEEWEAVNSRNPDDDEEQEAPHTGQEKGQPETPPEANPGATEGITTVAAPPAGEEAAEDTPPPEAYEETPAFPRDYTLTLTSQDDLTDLLTALEKGAYRISYNANRFAVYKKGCPRIVRAKGEYKEGKPLDQTEGAVETVAKNDFFENSFTNIE